MDQPYLQKGPDEQWRMVHPEHIERFEELFYEALEQIAAEPGYSGANDRYVPEESSGRSATL